MATPQDVFSSDFGSVPGADFAGSRSVLGDTKPSQGPSSAYPDANDGYSPGDAMSDAVVGIQHSGPIPDGGDSPQSTGVVDRDLHSQGKVVGGPSVEGKTFARTPNPNTVAGGVAYSSSPADMADPAKHDPAVPNPGTPGQLSSGVSVRIRDQKGQ